MSKKKIEVVIHDEPERNGCGGCCGCLTMLVIACIVLAILL